MPQVPGGRAGPRPAGERPGPESCNGNPDTSCSNRDTLPAMHTQQSLSRSYSHGPYLPSFTHSLWEQSTPFGTTTHQVLRDSACVCAHLSICVSMNPMNILLLQSPRPPGFSQNPALPLEQLSSQQGPHSVLPSSRPNCSNSIDESPRSMNRGVVAPLLHTSCDACHISGPQ